MQDEGHLFVAPPAGWTLTTILGEMLHVAEARFGPRDRSWTIIGIEIGETTQAPCVWFPGNRKHVAVRLAANAATCWRQACFQLAHEAVHPLDPNGGGKAPVIEEGVATTLADEMAFANGWNMKTVHPSYTRAKQLLGQLLALEPEAVSILRARAPFPKLTAEIVQERIAGCPRDLAEDLAGSFKPG